jgi:hypothetical protein
MKENLCNFKIYKQINFLNKKTLFILSMWKPTLGYGMQKKG